MELWLEHLYGRRCAHVLTLDTAEPLLSLSHKFDAPSLTAACTAFLDGLLVQPTDLATLLRCQVMIETYKLPLGGKSLPLVAAKINSAPDKSSAWLEKLSHEALLYVIRSIPTPPASCPHGRPYNGCTGFGYGHLSYGCGCRR